MSIHSAKLGILLPALLALVTGCGGSSGGTDNANLVNVPTPLPLPIDNSSSTRDVTINFTAIDGTGKSVGCNQNLVGLGTENQPVSLQALRFYISEPYLIRRDNTTVPITLVQDKWQSGQVALIDLENATGGCNTPFATAETQTQLRGRVPVGDYVGLGYTVGVPSDLNHTDTTQAAAPLDNAAMAWSWQSGRKFLRFELLPEGGVTRPATANSPASSAKAWMVHLGSTGCTGNPATGAIVNCASSNRMRFVAPAFDLQTQRVAVDLAGLLRNSTLGQDQGGAIGCMSAKDDPECVAIFNAFALDLASGQPINGGQGQTLFKVIAQ